MASDKPSSSLNKHITAPGGYPIMWLKMPSWLKSCYVLN